MNALAAFFWRVVTTPLVLIFATVMAWVMSDDEDDGRPE